MIWYDDLFVGESIRPRRQRRIIRKVNNRSLFNHAYLLTLASNPDNLLDIIHVQVLRQRCYPKRELVVIGIAGDYEEAMELAGKILISFYEAQGDFKLKEYISGYMQQQRLRSMKKKKADRFRRKAGTVC